MIDLSQDDYLITEFQSYVEFLQVIQNSIIIKIFFSIKNVLKRKPTRKSYEKVMRKENNFKKIQ